MKRLFREVIYHGPIIDKNTEKHHRFGEIMKSFTLHDPIDLVGFFLSTSWVSVEFVVLVRFPNV